MVESVELKAPNQVVEEIAIEGFDHVELYVGNALQACYYYHRGFGFDLVAYKGLETGSRDRVSYVLRQGKMHLVLTGALSADNEVAEHVHQHGDGVKNIGFRVKDARKAYETAVSRGATSVFEPRVEKDDNGTFVSACVRTYGDTTHTFVERHAYNGFAPGFQPAEKTNGNTGLLIIDHVVGNVEVGRMEHWIDFYKKTFGFYVYQYFGSDDISTQ